MTSTQLKQNNNHSNDYYDHLNQTNTSEQDHNMILENYWTMRLTRKIINDSDMKEYPQNIIEKRKRVANKFLDMVDRYDHNCKIEFTCDEIEKIDEDMLDVGKIEGKILKIDIEPIIAEIDLSKLIRNALLARKKYFIQMLISHNIDLFNIEPRIMIICAETNQDELMSELIDKKIHIHTDQYRCLYKLAADGKLPLIKKILKTYCFNNILEIISKICIQAIQNNHVHILKYLLKADAFNGLPDHMFSMFINSIEYSGHLDVIKFFVESGISIRRENYLALHRAIKFNNANVIKYFYDIDMTVDSILTSEQKEKYGLGKNVIMNQYIGTNTPCNISYDDINEGDTYYQCNKNLHYYKSDKWIEWCKNRPNIRFGENTVMFNSCPLCFAPIKKNLYNNSK